MKYIILDQEATIYSAADVSSPIVATLHAGDEITIGDMVKVSESTWSATINKLGDRFTVSEVVCMPLTPWVEICTETGLIGFIHCDTSITNGERNIAIEKKKGFNHNRKRGLSILLALIIGCALVGALFTLFYFVGNGDSRKVDDFVSYFIIFGLFFGAAVKFFTIDRKFL